MNMIGVILMSSVQLEMNGAEAPAANGESGGSQQFDVFADRVRAYGEFVRAVGMLKLQTAQAELVNAQAANEWQKAMILDAVREQLIYDLQRMNNQRRIYDREIHNIRKKARLATYLISGRPMATFNNCVDAYKHFERLALVQADADALFLPIPHSQMTINGGDFVDNDDPTTACLDPTERDLQNALSLMDWASRNHYFARTGSSAHRAIISLYQAIAAVANESVELMRKYLDEIQQQTYDVWNPIQIVGIASGISESSILNNTGPMPATRMLARSTRSTPRSRNT